MCIVAIVSGWQMKCHNPTVYQLNHEFIEAISLFILMFKRVFTSQFKGFTDCFFKYGRLILAMQTDP
jgi:hypothetical protein